MDRLDLNTLDSLVEEQERLQVEAERAQLVLEGLEAELSAIDGEMDALEQKQPQFEALGKVCGSLEELDSAGGLELFWDADDGDPRIRVDRARRKIDEYGEALLKKAAQRQTAAERIEDQHQELDRLHYQLTEAIEAEETFRNEWIVERDDDALPAHVQVMPWSRGYEEDRRFRKSLGLSLVTSLLAAFLLSSIALPIVERERIPELPERMAKLVREQLPPPPPAPVEAPPVEEELVEPEPEPEPELAEEVPPPDTVVPESTEEPSVAAVEPDTREQVKSKGILAFRDSFASSASLKPSADLGSQARVRNAGEDSVGRPQRAMVTSLAPGSSGGINLADISRDVGGGGGQGLGGVQISRVASSIGGGGGTADRPMAGGAVAGRTDEEIQIVFDRYKAALYRLYNRELRKNPTLRGQIVLRLTIEPDGSVSFCVLQSSDMEAPALAEQVVDRVTGFDFGAKEDIAAVTIIYPIDFLPAA
jgi:outer membrane biosynthesis protein TonB/rubrerythrin